MSKYCTEMCALHLRKANDKHTQSMSLFESWMEVVDPLVNPRLRVTPCKSSQILTNDRCEQD